jgi:hypothetical protein
MEFEIGQIFSGKYPPEAAVWANKNFARIVRHGAEDWLLEQIPSPTDEERKERKYLEIRNALTEMDWRSMREHDRSAFNPEYEPDRRVFAYKQFLRDFDEFSADWASITIPTFDEWVAEEEKENAKTGKQIQ